MLTNKIMEFFRELSQREGGMSMSVVFPQLSKVTRSAMVGIFVAAGGIAFFAIPHSAYAQTEMSFIDISAEVSENGACGRAANGPQSARWTRSGGYRQVESPWEASGEGGFDCMKVAAFGDGTYLRDSDVRFGISTRDYGCGAGDAPQNTVWTAWASQGGGWSPAQYSNSDPDCVKLFINVVSRPGYNLGPFRVGSERGDLPIYNGGLNCSWTGYPRPDNPVYSPYTDNGFGGGWTGWGGPGYGEPGCGRIYLETKAPILPIPPNNRATHTGNNFPLTTPFNPSECRGNCPLVPGTPLEINFRNDGNQPWISDFIGAQAGPSTGTCDDAFGTAPEDTNSNIDKSCVTPYWFSSTQVVAQHSGAFGTAPNNLRYRKFGYKRVKLDEYSRWDSCADVDEDGDCVAGKVSDTRYLTTYTGRDVNPGESVIFDPNFLTSPAAGGTYPETWTVWMNGTPIPTAYTVNISVAAPAVGTIDIFSKNRVTGSAVPSSWGSTPGGYNAGNPSEEHFTAVPNGSYTISPSANSAGTLYALGGVSTGLAVAEKKNPDSWLSSMPSYFSSLARAATVSREVNCNPPSTNTCPSTPNQSVTTADPNIIFNIVWDPRAVLGRSPSTINFFGQKGVDTTVPGTVTVNNNGGAPGSQLNWTATDNQSWLSLSSTSWQNAQGSSTNFQATADITNLAPGNYTGR